MERTCQRNKDQGSSESTNLKPIETPTTGAVYPERFAMDVVHTAYHLKTGGMPGTGEPIDAGPFSKQKAKAIRLSMLSFPTFVIRTPQQRSSYGKKVGEGDEIPLSTKNSKMESS
jgi:hypothetical protein